ncbi:carbohydrate ABC transporter permease [Microbacterium thalassium]|uniref:Raffinose/stachyose/melibiose transport system permease protein n=1 Tax=Microbacterium thalassium TaxID=362649 RepID=A0A7X0FQ24_9MICO|nr:sugar ABC transporter permease [Microbacterium thalassium]MBB6391610.1 raffinose/stachyose/melibiose transport system permease protein [Microbacterium thalassium]GLK24213.1 ABC transporter permease [Microbacterium thalassium]
MKKSLRRWGWLFTGPVLAAFMIGFIVPFVLGVYLSFTEFRTVTKAEWVGFDNYIKMWGDDVFLHSLWYTAAFAIVTTILINVLAFIVAYLLVKTFRGKNIFRSVFFMPNLIGGIVLGYIWLLLLNGILGFWARSITYDESYGFWGMVILMCWQQIGYMMVIYIAGLQSVPTELLEAAEVDGANKRRTLFSVTIPLVMPAITVCTFLTITNGFKMFDQNLALTNGAPSRLSELLALNIFNTFYGRPGFEGVGQAKAVVFLIIVAGIALFQNWYARSKETAA